MDWARRRIDQANVFVAGDFNFEVTIDDESHLYTDNVKHDSEAYSYILKYLRDLGRDAGDTAINDRRIDYIFGPVEKVVFRPCRRPSNYRNWTHGSLAFDHRCRILATYKRLGN